jgi:putative addiction module killer protein
MYEIVKSETFLKWLRRLKDQKAKYKILARLKKIEEGYLGNYKRLDFKISELKFDHGPGYRIYISIKINAIVILLCAGDKRSQKRDIIKAHKLIGEWEAQNE